MRVCAVGAGRARVLASARRGSVRARWMRGSACVCHRAVIPKRARSSQPGGGRTQRLAERLAVQRERPENFGGVLQLLLRTFRPGSEATPGSEPGGGSRWSPQVRAAGARGVRRGGSGGELGAGCSAPVPVPGALCGLGVQRLSHSCQPCHSCCVFLKAIK